MFAVGKLINGGYYIESDVTNEKEFDRMVNSYVSIRKERFVSNTIDIVILFDDNDYPLRKVRFSSSGFQEVPFTL